VRRAGAAWISPALNGHRQSASRSSRLRAKRRRDVARHGCMT
jgi:hypothetical protein